MIREGADRTFNVKYDKYRKCKVNVLYEENLKKHQRYFRLTHIVLRVPKDTTDEWITDYINRTETKEWIKNEFESFKDIELEYKLEIKSRHLKLEPRKTKEEFKKIIDKYIDKYTPKFGKPKVRIRTVKNAWGRCNRNKDTLTFNPLLGYLPEKYIEHTVYHEMIHTYCANHNPPFYRKMKEEYPDWREYEYDKGIYYYLTCKNEIYDF